MWVRSKLLCRKSWKETKGLILERQVLAIEEKRVVNTQVGHGIEKV